MVSKEVTRKRIYFDIETSPNVALTWRTGYKINLGPDNILEERAIICICWKVEGEDEVHHLTWDKKQCDKKMLQKFIRVANGATELVGHNGDRFDLKWVKTRCLFHRIPAFPEYTTIDTLKLVKKHFYLNSNRLDYVGKFLGLGGKQETGGFDLWKRIVLDKDRDALDKMVEYCKRDVILLEEVHQEIKNYVEHKFNYATFNGGEGWECPECGSTHVRINKTRTTKLGTIRREMQCKTCAKSYTISNRKLQGYYDHKMKQSKGSK